MGIHIREKCADCGGRGIMNATLMATIDGERELPPRPCLSCRGTGYIKEWVSVNGLLALLLANLEAAED